MTPQERVAAELQDDPPLALLGAKIVDILEDIGANGVTLDRVTQLERFLETGGIRYSSATVIAKYFGLDTAS